MAMRRSGPKRPVTIREFTTSMKGSSVVRRTGFILLAAIVLAGCQKKEDSKSESTGGTKESEAAVSAPAQSAPVAARPSSQKLGPRRLGPEYAQALVGLTWIKGGPVSLTRGTVYVVEFWATWCPPCKISIPHLTELQKKYMDKGVVFVGVSDEPPDVTTPFVKEMGDKMDYSVASDTQGVVYGGYMGVFHQDGIPTAFVVDAAGKVAWFGHPLDPQFEKAIQLAIAAKDAAQKRG